MPLNRARIAWAAFGTPGLGHSAAVRKPAKSRPALWEVIGLLPKNWQGHSQRP